ncbi:hypothetical protein DBB29_20245 [Pandoraea cepalis]|uniref:Flagellar motor switch protein FliN-like C-terminal domain-containing protein n=1 Tax=Pandoraea cepalis TaxID=2508294 RepID=A0AAW7MN13_9BURK|nr:FliM/FliN family flagellar motor switch protein [Pandoraea cepalis]MDN4573900.1 hypothetical protein [Pandoraea cepalis]MDN4580436.1 hypothetical protein [Pandoraea cepalis]
MNTMHAPTPPGAIRALDPCRLGQPTQLLDPLTERLRSRLDVQLPQHVRHRHAMAWRVAAMSVSASAPSVTDVIVQRFQVDGHGIDVAIDAGLLRDAFRLRYDADDFVGPPALHAAPPAATYERFVTRFARQMLDALRQAVSAEMSPTTACVETLQSAPRSTPPSLWIGARIADRAGDAPLGTVTFRLAAEDARRWLTMLGPDAGERVAEHTPPACDVATIPVRLSAHWLDVDLSLGALLDAQPGDVLPVRFMQRALVCVDNDPLMSADIVERDAHLCLTHFQTLE